jgi:translocation and assembly module TamB
LNSPRLPRRRTALIATAGVFVLIAGASAFVLGPGAPWIVAKIADGRAVWRLGTLELEGIKGTSLGDLTAARATLRDGDGVWAEARDLRLDWDPLRILSGTATIREASAAHLRIFRQPHLTPPRPPGRRIDVDLSSIAVARLDVDEAVFGEAAAFSLRGGLLARGSHIDSATLDAKRLDAASDTLTLDFTRLNEVRLNLELESPRGGFFSAALDSDAPVSIDATASGDQTAGRGSLAAIVGKDDLARGGFSWTADRWTAGADIDLSRAPVLHDLQDAFGARMRLDGTGDRARQRDFTATLVAQHAGVEARGKLGDDFEIDGPVALKMRADRLQAFTPGVSAGGARFEGEMSREGDVTQFEGRLEGIGVSTADIRTTFAGPARVRLTRDLIDISATADISNANGLPAVTRLLRDGKLSFEGRYDRGDRRIAVRALRVASPQADVSATGVLGEGAGGLKGRWRILRLDAVDPAISGLGDGSWTLAGGFGGRPFLVTANGAAQRFGTRLAPLDQLLGAAPALDAQFSIKNGVIGVQQFNVRAPRLRFGAIGSITRGDADLRIEASAQGPVNVGTTSFDGVADATGTLKGKLDNPTLVTETRLSRMDVAGLLVEAPIVRLNFAPRGAGRTGRVDIAGTVQGAPATASADLAADDNGLALNNLSLSAAGFTAQGDARFGDAGPTVDVAFSGAVNAVAAPLTGQVAGVAKLRPTAQGEAVLDAEAHLVRGTLGNLAFSRLDVRANGPLDHLRFAAGARGLATGQSLSFDAKGTLDRAGETTRMRFEGQGVVAAVPVATRGPFQIEIDGTTTARGELALGDGRATLDYADTPAGLRFSARMENAPIAPVFAFLGERATGIANGTLTARGNGALEADIDMQVRDALFAERARDPLNMDLDGRVAGNIMTLRAGVTSRNGLDAAIDGRAPVSAQARPLRIALDGEGRATWRAKGPAEALWGLVGSLDQSVTGAVDGAGEIRFAVGRLSGSGGLTLAVGRFADKQTGIDLREVNARVEFDNTAAKLVSFGARDARGGTVTASGAAQGLKEGRIDLQARDVQLLGRPDARAVASGPLSLRWTADGISLTGDLNISEATLAPPRAAENIAEIEVVEVNLPEAIQPKQRATQAAIPTAVLDVRVRAPGRVFLRGRGLDSEWALDMRVAGTAANPQVYGEARLIRGRFTLAGRPFEAQRGLIRFNGAPEEALIDLVAELTGPDLTARVALSGPVSDPDISLSSTPSLPEDEILPQALFGRAADDLSALEAAQLAGSLAELAGQASINLAGAARDLVGLDRLDVREETSVGLRVAGGKYLTRNVYLEVARTGVGETETQVEWQVRPRLYLISSFEPNGDRRLSVRWRREY